MDQDGNLAPRAGKAQRRGDKSVGGAGAGAGADSMQVVTNPLPSSPAPSRSHGLEARRFPTPI